MAYLKIRLPDGTIQRRELTGKVCIGRAAECEICLHDQALSRRHCAIERAGEEWVLTDLESRNGTFVGVNRVTRHQLLDGNVLRAGNCRIIFYAVGRSVARPQSPDESLFSAKVDNELLNRSLPNATNQPRPQPKAAHQTQKSSNSTGGSDTIDLGPSASPLAFKRPPARPLVKHPTPEQ